MARLCSLASPAIVVVVMCYQDGFPDLGKIEPEGFGNTARAREHARRQNQSVDAIYFEAGLSIHDREVTSTGVDE